MLRRRSLVLFTVLALSAVALGGCLPGANKTFDGPVAGHLIPFKGFGVWWDVWDWSPSMAGGSPALGLGDVDRIAAQGAQTLYIQTATFRRDANVLDEPVLRRIIGRAHARGMKVVGWYLPQLLDTKTDVKRLSAMVALGVDGMGVDIESTDNPDVADRTAKLLAEVQFLRLLHPDVPMAAIPVTPVIWEGLNRGWWPNFPYRELSKYFDVWMPMAYWSYRKTGSFSEWGDPYRYIAESVTQLRSLTGRPNLPVHPIGGEGIYHYASGDVAMSVADANAMARAVLDTRSIGGSIYDDRTTPASIYPALAQMRRAQVK